MSFLYLRYLTGIVCLFASLSCGHSGRAHSYIEVFNSLTHQEQLVFDVSNQFDKGNHQWGQHEIELRSSSGKRLEDVGVHLSPFLYYRKKTNGAHHALPKPSQEHPDIYELPLGMIFARHSSFPQRLNFTEPTTLKSIEDHLTKMKHDRGDELTAIFKLSTKTDMMSEAEVKNAAAFLSDFKSHWNNKVNFGLEHDFLFNQTNVLHPLGSSVDMNILIINFDIPPENFILSYSYFKRFLRGFIDQTINSTNWKDNPNKTIYVKMNLADQNHSSLIGDEKLRQKYYYYLLQFSAFWLNDGERERIILDSFPISLSHLEKMNGMALRDIIEISIDELEAMADADGACEKNVLLEQILSVFNRVIVSKYNIDLLDTPVDCSTTQFNTTGTGCPQNLTNKHLCNPPGESAFSPDIHLKFPVRYPRKTNDQLNKTIQVLEGHSLKLIEFDVVSYDEESFALNFKEGRKLLPPDVAVACSFNFQENRNEIPGTENVLGRLSQDCNFIWNQSSVIIWKISLYSTMTPLDLTVALHNIENTRQEFLQQFPDKSVLLLLMIHFEPEPVNGLYCDPQIEQNYGLVEIIINFAKVHNISFEFLPPHPFGYSYGWWKMISPVRDVNLKETKFPILIARNYPEKFLLGEFHTEPCIPWNDRLVKEEIRLEYEYGGSTLYMGGVKNSSVGREELEMLLLMTFHKFSLVEVIPESISDAKALFGVLSSLDFVTELGVQGINTTNLRVFIRMDCMLFEEEEDKMKMNYFTEKLSQSEVKLVGVHFVNLGDCLSLPGTSTFTRKLISNGVNLGISLEDCLDEVNNGFNNLQKLLQNFKEVDYLLCNIKYPARATNVEKVEMEKYLDTSFYVKKYFQRIFPTMDKEIMFRLNSVPNMRTSGGGGTSYSKEETDEQVVLDFLKFFADVGQYAGLNQMKMFMFPAFDNMLGSQFGWCKIADFQNLTNGSVFTEKESEYLKKETWRPSPAPELETDSTELIMAAMGIAIISLIVILFFVQLWYRKRFALLGKAEVDEFLYGKSQQDTTDERDKFDTAKFPPEFEIERSRIILLKLIGKGNFGLVYKAAFSKQDGSGSDSPNAVAVKIPHPSCSKESFKSMLSELKVLCYIDHHQNVLQFVGAYVKQIGKGVLYIATELCENGALQEYLRSLRKKLSEGTETLEREVIQQNLHDLIRFAKEIAQGMEYIASRKVIHGDLSTRNVLLDLNLTCKIGDFGLSRKLYEYQTYVKKNKDEALPWRWLAIESLQRFEFTTKSDVWSYGITLWEIFSLGDVPYPGLSWKDGFLEKIENGYKMAPPTFSNNAIYQEMKGCWDLSPMLRPTFTELADFFSNVQQTGKEDQDALP